MLLQNRKIHKWLGIILGIPLLIWVITGIVMNVSFFLPKPSVVSQSNYISDNESQLLWLSPYDALKGLNNALWEKGEIRSLRLRHIDNVYVYEFVLAGGKKYLVNANTGLQFKITPEVAKSIARKSLGREASVLSVEILEKHSYFYTYGSLPVYKVVLDGNTCVYVSHENGKVLGTHNRWRRFLTVNHDLHTFGFIKKLIIRSTTIQTFLLILVALATVSIFVTGYYQVFRRQKRI